MGCCGQDSSSRCNLCSQGSKKWFPWGAKRKICWRCEARQRALINEREALNFRARTLLAGKDLK